MRARPRSSSTRSSQRRRSSRLSGIQQEIAVALVHNTGRLGLNDPINGIPLVVHAVRGLLRADCVRHVVVAAPEPQETAAALNGLATVVPSGPEWIQAALAKVPDARIVLVHDAARPFTPPELIRAVAEAVAGGAPAVVPVLPVADTVKLVDADGVVTATPNRIGLRETQSPRGYAVEAVDDPGVPLRTVPGHIAAMKINTPFDLVVAEAVLTP